MSRDYQEFESDGFCRTVEDGIEILVSRKSEWFWPI